MSSYTEWDRAAYIERVGGEQQAERRRAALVEGGLAAVAEWKPEHRALADDERGAVTRRFDAVIDRPLPYGE